MESVNFRLSSFVNRACRPTNERANQDTSLCTRNTATSDEGYSQVLQNIGSSYNERRMNAYVISSFIGSINTVSLRSGGL
jgi:hypothetical protein